MVNHCCPVRLMKSVTGKYIKIIKIPCRKSKRKHRRMRNIKGRILRGYCLWKLCSRFFGGYKIIRYHCDKFYTPCRSYRFSVNATFINTRNAKTAIECRSGIVGMSFKLTGKLKYSAHIKLSAANYISGNKSSHNT